MYIEAKINSRICCLCNIHILYIIIPLSERRRGDGNFKSVLFNFETILSVEIQTRYLACILEWQFLYSRTSKIRTPKIRAPPSTGQLICPILC